jgi:hypothetical protein
VLLSGKENSMKIKTKICTISTILVLASGLLTFPVSASGVSENHSQFINAASNYELNENQQLSVPSVLYLDESTNFKIGQQPPGNINFVTSFPNYVTEYSEASKHGSIGLLAHNYLAGQHFFQIAPGQEIKLGYSDKKTELFLVTEIKKYQALYPNSPSSDFIDLATGERLSAFQLFENIYAEQTSQLVLQTCISANQNLTWGRLFIIAKPVT